MSVPTGTLPACQASSMRLSWEILHRDPQIAAMLLGRAGVRLPSGATPVVADSNVSARDPSTLISDNVIVFQRMDRKVAVIAEVQKGAPDPTRRFAWPAYVCNARVAHGCDVVLMVAPGTRRRHFRTAAHHAQHDQRGSGPDHS